MASYDQTDFDRMRQEAVARARDMQRRAQSLVNGQEPSSIDMQEGNAEKKVSAPISQQAAGGILSSLLGDSKIDEEKALIGMLIYILYKNGADVKLMLALGYLLL